MLMLLLRQEKSLTIKADKRKAAQLAENERRFDWLVNVSMNSEGFICVCARVLFLFLIVRAPLYVF